ncbi:MAG TPA: cytochrome c peroxidase [Kofleriaceae bacterium]|nr:cytochrome c peroxidase [Kofleriaceae bacterium]
MAGSLVACTDETTFTQEERDILSEFRLPERVPLNPSNKYADDSAAAILGKKFFFDPRFSGALGPANDGTTNGSLGVAGAVGKVSCYSCHQIEIGGADRRSRPQATSLGVNYGLRNAPTVINTAYSDTASGGWQLWDGRKDSLWALALGPMEGANEHNGTRLQYAHLVFDKYRAEYEAAFVTTMPDLADTTRFPLTGKPGQPAFENMASADKVEVNRIYSNIGKAMEAYERRLVSTSFEKSPFDKMLDGDETAMSPAAVRGAKLFVGKAACDECHRGALFTDYKFHNIGCPQEGQNVPTVDVGRTNGIARVKADAFNRAGAYSDLQDDAHLANLVEQSTDLGAFRTPSLRNVEKTAPYMHNGVYTNMWDVVSHYNFGGGTGAYSGTKESAVSPLLLTNEELDDIVEFLRSLSDGPPLASEDFPVEGLVAPPTLPE